MMPSDSRPENQMNTIAVGIIAIQDSFERANSGKRVFIALHKTMGSGQSKHL
jgi:hypothetical protein